MVDAALSELEVAGCAVVPREPTEEMIEAARKATRQWDGDILAIWQAMLDAARGK
jgi:hypothetical protein